MEKSGLCVTLGVHRLDGTCGWAMVASVLRPCRRECQGSRVGGSAGQLCSGHQAGWAEATLLGQEMTEAQGGMTCLRPPHE